MNFSAHSVWELTKLFVRDPAEASSRVLGIGWPINVSVLMIVLAGIISGVMWAVDQTLFGASPTPMILPDGREMMVPPPTPMMVGVYSAILGVVLSYLIYWVGRRSGGQGSLQEVMSVMAALQIALTVLSVLSGVVGIALPLLGLIVAMFVVIVTVRGYGHAVMQAHRFQSMGRAVMVFLAALILSAFIFLMLSVFLTPVFMPDLLSEIENAL